MHALAGDEAKDQPIVARRMLPSDVPAVLAIQSESPEASLWTAESLMEVASKEGAWVAALGGSVVGFLAGRAVSDEFEIMNLAVARTYRRRGAGTGLVNAALAWSRTAGAIKAFLEVRASNSGAIAFYARLDFKVSGRRQKYYQVPEEDAVLMCRDSTPAGYASPAEAGSG
jgi:ribosomal-protein-alanine N-acetyltransferase